MTKREENKFTMYKAVEAVLDADQEAFSQINAFMAAIEKFKNSVSEIAEMDNKKENAVLGKTISKANAKDDLIETIIPLVRSLYLYGRASENEDIQSAADVSETGLKRLRDTLLIGKGRSIYDLLNDNLSELSDYNVTEASVLNLYNKILEYENAMGSKEDGFASRSAAREELDNLFDKTDDILYEDLDSFVDMIKYSNSEFYNRYRSARVIRDLGER